MKNRFYYILLSAVIACTACSKSDPFEGTTEVFDPPVFSDATPVDAKVKQMFTAYNVHFKPTFEQNEYTWNWENKIGQTAAEVSGLRYTPADRNYAIPVIDSIENWIFKIFPADFSRKYMPLNILMTDTMENKFLSGATVTHRIYEGYMATNYILVSYVSNRFDAQKTKRLLRDSWLSLFMEKIITRIPYPIDFAKISVTGYAKASFTNAEDVMTGYALLKKGRTKQTTGTATSAWTRTTVAQDFGDFVAFIVYTPDTEKDAAYAKNAAIRTKVDMIKNYFKDNFGITLPYLPIQP
jgi:hypothetical protein